jgi:exopolysaccharide production protein ExoQ
LGYLYRIVVQDSSLDNLSNASAATADGSVYNKVLIAVLLAVGLLHFRSAANAARKSGVAVSLMLLGAYISWSLLTILWSDDPALSIRRLGAYIMIVCACACLGCGYYGRDSDQLQLLRRHVSVAGVIAVVAFVVAAARNSASPGDMLAPEWSLKEGFYVAPFAFTTAYALTAVAAHTGRAVWKNVLAIGGFIFVILAVKARTNVLAATASVLVCRAYLARRVKRLALLLLAIAVAAIIFDFVTGARAIQLAAGLLEDSSPQILPYVTIGRGEEDLSSMSGRAPLWNVLYAEVPRQPLLGHGFGAFWTAGRLEQIYGLVGWRAVVAHNGFLDEILATGLLGFILMISFWGHAFARLLVCASRGQWFGAMVLAWLVLLLLSNTTASIFQADVFQFPLLASLVGIFAVLSAQVPMEVPSYEIPEWQWHGIGSGRESRQ